MNQDERRKTENMLLAMGLPGLDDPNLLQVLANLIAQWPGDKSQFFIDMLNEVDAKDRYEAYQKLAPRLGFKPPSFIDCETLIQMRASEMVSQGRTRVEGSAPMPMYVGERKPEEAASATMKCHTCGKKSRFAAETPVSAVIKARKAGWVRTLGIDEETCPKCVKKAAKKPRVLMAIGDA